MFWLNEYVGCAGWISKEAVKDSGPWLAPIFFKKHNSPKNSNKFPKVIFKILKIFPRETHGN